MNRIYIFRSSSISVRFGKGNLFHISLVSKRTAKLMMKKSFKDEWDFKVFSYFDPIFIDNVRIVGFQPETGRHIGIIEKD